MPDIDLDDIRRLDGSLLLVFQELVRSRRTTTAARRLGMSQSAVSHALGRLRDIFREPLFLRRPHGLEPTARALELAPRVDVLIEQMAATLAPGFAFNPSRSRRRFAIALTEYAVGVFTPELLNLIRQEAPDISFALQFVRGYVALGALRRSVIDLALGRFDPPPEGVRSIPLFEDRYCVVSRGGVATVDGYVDQEAWRRAEHVFVATSPLLDEVSEASVGEDRMPTSAEVKVLGVVPRWEMALSLVAGCDAIATCPRRLALQQAGRLGLQIAELAPDFPGWTVSLTRRAEDDQGLDWLCQTIERATPGSVAEVR